MVPTARSCVLETISCQCDNGMGFKGAVLTLLKLHAIVRSEPVIRSSLSEYRYSGPRSQPRPNSLYVQAPKYPEIQDFTRVLKNNYVQEVHICREARPASGHPPRWVESGSTPMVCISAITGINLITRRPRHPETQDLIEQANQGFKASYIHEEGAKNQSMGERTSNCSAG